MRRLLIVSLVWVICVGCDAFTPATPTPTRHFSAPTVAPSPTVGIRTSDELYDDVSDSLANDGLFRGSGQNDPTAAAMPNEGDLPPFVLSPLDSPLATPPFGSAQTVQIVMNDGVILRGQLREYISDQLVPDADLIGQRRAKVPGVLLLAADGSAWGALPTRLHAAGFTVLAMSLPDNTQTPYISTLLISLSEVTTVDPNRIAIIGAERYADMALLTCSINTLCDALALLTPISNDTLANVVTTYLPRPLFVSSARDDAETLRTAQTLVGLAGGAAAWYPYETGRGTNLVMLYPELVDALVAWVLERV